jgi:hypothetical protein
MKNTESIMKFAHAGIQGLDLVTGGKGCKSKKSKSKKSKSKCKKSKSKSKRSGSGSRRSGSNGGGCYRPCR